MCVRVFVDPNWMRMLQKGSLPAKIKSRGSSGKRGMEMTKQPHRLWVLAMGQQEQQQPNKDH